jgi:hypothetical protein
MKFFPWSLAQESKIEKFNTPEKIQAFLDQAQYNVEGTPRIPSHVLKMKKAHCFDGAVFAASVLAYHGEPPLILDLCAVRDDDHILAIYRQGPYLGAIAKSNYVGLRFREPIFKTARELVLSYFESYFNLQREKSLREYSEPFDLRKIKQLEWSLEEGVFDQIAQQIVKARHFPILTKNQVRKLKRVDCRTFNAGLVGSLR